MKRYGPLAVMMAVVPLLAFGPADRTAGTRWAFVVGISDYIHFDDVEGGDLPGAEHDARTIRDLLVAKKGFPEANVRLLLNGEATRSAIEEGLTGWLASNARPGDNVVVFFAGHGSQMWDEDGDEDDGLDETIAPADVHPSNTEFDISDDTFNDWLGTLPTDNVVVILDNCNSGTGTRDVTPFSRSRRLGRDLEDLPRPPGAARRALAGQEDMTGFDVGPTRVLELAAAQPNQAAVDAFFPAEGGAEPFHGGAFTTYLVRQLWRSPADATYEDVFRQVEEALKRNRFQQDPFISEDVALRSLPLFFTEGAPTGRADASVPVVSVQGSTVELGGGFSLGITSGSIFETESGARVVIEAVAQGSSTGRVASGSVSEGDPARLVGYRFPETPLLVNVAGIDSESGDALAGALGGAPGVQLVREPEGFSHLLVRRRGGELRIVGSDGFVRHEGLAIGDEGTADLADKLRSEAAAKRLADMENPAPDFGVTIEMEGGRSSFGLGERVSFTVTSERAGYVTLIDLGTDGLVAMLLPNESSPSMRIEANGRVAFPTPQSGVDIQAQPPVGRGMVRVLVTPEPLDIAIEPGSVYAAGGEEFAEAVAAALRGAVGQIDGAVRLDNWSSASLVYDLHN